MDSTVNKRVNNTGFFKQIGVKKTKKTNNGRQYIINKKI